MCRGFFFCPGEFRNVPLIFGAALANQRQERAGHCAFTILEVKRISDWSGQSAISLLLEYKNSLENIIKEVVCITEHLCILARL